MILFDYIFYRVAKFFYSKDGTEAVRALGFIVVIQGLLLISLFFSIMFLSGVVLHIASYSKMIGLVLLIILGLFNYFRYKGRYMKLVNRWSGRETKIESLIKGILVIMAIVLPYVLAVWTGLLALQK